MPKDFYSNDHSIQVGTPGSGDGSLQIDVEKNIEITSLGNTNITGVNRVVINSDEDITIHTEGGIISISDGDGHRIRIEDKVYMDSNTEVVGELKTTYGMVVDANRNNSGASLFSISNDGETYTDFVVGKDGLYKYMWGSLPLQGHKYVFSFYNKSFFTSYSTSTDSHGEDCLELGTTSTITSYIPLDIPYGCCPENIYVAGESTNGTGVLDTEIHRIRITKATGVIQTSASTDSLNYGTGDFLHNQSFAEDVEVCRTIDSTYEYKWAFKMVVSGQSVNSFRLRYIKYTWK